MANTSPDSNDPSLVKLGDALRRLRRGRKLSQEKLAHEAGVNVSYVASIERAENNPTVLTLTKLAAVLNVTVEQLMGEAGI